MSVATYFITTTNHCWGMLKIGNLIANLEDSTLPVKKIICQVIVPNDKLKEYLLQLYSLGVTMKLEQILSMIDNRTGAICSNSSCIGDIPVIVKLQVAILTFTSTQDVIYRETYTNLPSFDRLVISKVTKEGNINLLSVAVAKEVNQ